MTGVFPEKARAFRLKPSDGAEAEGAMLEVFRATQGNRRPAKLTASAEPDQANDTRLLLGQGGRAL